MFPCDRHLTLGGVTHITQGGGQGVWKAPLLEAQHEKVENGDGDRGGGGSHSWGETYLKANLEANLEANLLTLTLLQACLGKAMSSVWKSTVTVLSRSHSSTKTSK